MDVEKLLASTFITVDVINVRIRETCGVAARSGISIRLNVRHSMTMVHCCVQLGSRQLFRRLLVEDGDIIIQILDHYIRQ